MEQNKSFESYLWISLTAEWWWKFHVTPLLLADIVSALVNFSREIEHVNFAIVHHCKMPKKTNTDKRLIWVNILVLES